MHKEDALVEIQKMHETKEVTRKSIIGWYSFYSQKLPKMKPERSDVDLIRTIALWMDLTDKGGRPPFPYNYKSKINLESIDMNSPAKESKLFPVGILTFLIGIILLFFNWRLGIFIMLIGPAILFIGYKLQGGATNPDILKENSLLFRKEGERVFNWMEGQITREN
ncbi:MAG: hypothetical protein ACE5HI_12470 [bacterium]